MEVEALLKEATLLNQLLYGLVATLILWLAYQAVELTWLTPRRHERALRAQGLRGTPYRFLAGDDRAYYRLATDARATPMPRCHDIIPRVNPFLHNAVKEYGAVSFNWFGPIPSVSIGDAEMVKEILTNKNGHFEKFNLGPVRKLLVLGLEAYSGEQFVLHKRILTSAFRIERLKSMLPAFSMCCGELISRWESKIAGPECGSLEVDVFPEFQNLAADGVSRAAFGSNLLEQGRRMCQLQKEQGEALYEAIHNFLVYGCLYFPTGLIRKVKKNNREMDNFLLGLIEKRERAIEAGDVGGVDLLTPLLEPDRDTGKRLSREEILEECKLYCFSGMQPLSTLLTWALILLGMHPDWQTRAREEVLSVFGEDKPDLDGLSRLKTVTMILHEVLRLYPPTAHLYRRTSKEAEAGGVKFPKGAILSLQMIQLHHSPDVWGKDVLEFNPERFADGVAAVTKGKTAAYLPFGYGWRPCVGQNYAFLETKVALSMILQRLSFELSPSYKHAPVCKALIYPQHGAQMLLKRL